MDRASAGRPEALPGGRGNSGDELKAFVDVPVNPVRVVGRSQRSLEPWASRRR